MLIDSSALLAILLGETDAEQIGRAIDNDPTRFISGVSVVETSIVVETRYGPIGGRELDLLLHNAAIETVPLTLEQVDWARYAARVYAEVLASDEEKLCVLFGKGGVTLLLCRHVVIEYCTCT